MAIGCEVDFTNNLPLNGATVANSTIGHLDNVEADSYEDAFLLINAGTFQSRMKCYGKYWMLWLRD